MESQIEHLMLLNSHLLNDVEGGAGVFRLDKNITVHADAVRRMSTTSRP
jgi:hypothetical protein